LAERTADIISDGDEHIEVAIVIVVGPGATTAIQSVGQPAFLTDVREDSIAIVPVQYIAGRIDIRPVVGGEQIQIAVAVKVAPGGGNAVIAHFEKLVGIFLVVDRRLVPNVFKVYPGFFMTKMGENIRCYSRKIFKEQFVEEDESIKPWIDFMEKHA
jgi:hypothetical protein